MKFYHCLPFLFYLTTISYNSQAQKDTSKIYDIDDVTVVSLTKETRNLLHYPSSISYLKAQQIEQLGVTSLKDLTAYLPNFYMPDYGTRITSSIYIRGLGSRINNPSVGIYLDNVPLLDKSSFDLELLNIERIEVLRGPQGTLYGRNTLGGLINITTVSPFKNKGLQAQISYGTYNDFRGNITLSHSYKNKLALSIGGGFEQADGFFKNDYDTTTSKSMDFLNAYNARLKFTWYIIPDLKLDFTVNGQISEQGGFPYRKIDAKNVNYNDPSYYNRDVINNSLYLEYKNPKFVLSSATGYQYFGDKMVMDQDYTAASSFTLTQIQYQHGITQEFLIKSSLSGNYQYTFGLMGFYQDLLTHSLVDFKDDFLRNLEKTMSPFPGLQMKITDSIMSVPGRYNTQTYGLAAYHQSTYNNLFIDNLSATLGIRVDYEQAKLTYDSNSAMSLQIKTYPAYPSLEGGSESSVTGTTTVMGSEPTTFFPILPKLALNYIPDKRCFLFGSISRGYSSGGFNIQRFGDIVQQRVQADAMEQAGQSTVGIIDTTSLQQQIVYKPEYSWNFEVGTRSELIAQKLFLDLTYFFILSTDKQVSVFAPSGLGRMTLNSAKAQSQGIECVLSGTPLKNLWLSANYGFTHAIFTKHDNGKKTTDREYRNYKGNYIPFVPMHTISVRGDYTLPFNRVWIESLKFSIQYNMLSDIFWTEDNTVLQPFYGLLNAQIWYNHNIFSVGLWGKNLTQTKYHTFYIESLGNKFVQDGKPFQFGFSILLHI